MTNTSLKSASIELPPLWEYPWQEAIDSNEGEALKLLELCSQQSKLLENSKSWLATPEAIGWLTLWTRNYQQMQGAISLLQSDPGVTKCGQVFTLELVWRSAFELNLQLRFIQGEIFPQSPTDEDKNEEIAKRLNAFTAWSVYQDKEFSSELRKTRLLDSIWDPTFAKTLEQDPRIGEFIHNLWGDDYDTTEEEQLEGKRRQREIAHNKTNAYMNWLQHPRLIPWFEEIRERSARRNWPKNFFDLVSRESDSVKKTMKEVFSTDIHYPVYKRSSQIAHGSSIDSFLSNIAGRLMPSVVTDDDEVQSAAGNVRRFCHFNCQVLASLHEIIKQYSEPEE